MVEKIIIAAAAKNDTIGVHGRLPWHLPADLQRFKELTTGHAVIMGRTTYESLDAPLENRLNIILTTKRLKRLPGMIPVSGMKYALFMARNHEKVYFAGGQRVYEEAMFIADTIELTRLRDNYLGDTFFPEIPTDFEEVSKKDHLKYSFLRYERK